VEKTHTKHTKHIASNRQTSHFQYN